MSATIDDAQEAVRRVLLATPREHEAAYRVIFEAVNICIAAGLDRKDTAQRLGIDPKRIDRHGHYFRTLRGTFNLFRQARNPRAAWHGTDEIVQKAWRR